MPAYLARRLIQAALILLGVAAITYVLLYMLPADPARMVAGRTATKEQVELVRIFGDGISTESKVRVADLR